MKYQNVYQTTSYGPFRGLLCWILLLLYIQALVFEDSIRHGHSCTDTHQVRCVTTHRNQMFDWIVGWGPDKSINFSVLMDYSDTFPVTDIHTTVNTDGNTLGKCQSSFSSWSTITASENI